MPGVLSLGLPEVADSWLAALADGSGIGPVATLPEFDGELSDVSFGALAKALDSLAPQASSIIAIYPARRAARIVAALSVARRALDFPAIAGYPTWLSPLGGALLAGLLGRLAADPAVPAAGLLAAAPAISARLTALAWLPSVANLDVPGLDIADQVASFVPGTSFVVQLSPTIRKVQVRRKSASPVVLDAPSIAIAAGPPAAWVDDVLLPALQCQDVRRAIAMPAVADWWQSAKAVEVVAIPLDVMSDARAIVAATPLYPCPWCGERMQPPVCAFCDYTAGAAV